MFLKYVARAAVGCVALAGRCGAALAQPVDNALEETLVTAEFRQTPLLDLSASASVIAADTLYDLAAQHLEDVLGQAPNVNYASGSSRARYYQIRGVGERSQFQDPLNPSVGLVVDDVDFSGLGAVGTLFDVAQVEILRGPQGTLHGANALAGLVNIRTGEPTDTLEQRVNIMLAQYNTWSAGIVSSGPMSEQLLFRLAVNAYVSNGFMDNSYLDIDDSNNRDEITARAKVRWLATEASTLDLTVSYLDADNGYDAFSLDNTRKTLSDQPGHDRQETTAVGTRYQSSLAAINLEMLVSYARSKTDYAYDEDWSFENIHPFAYSSFDQYLRQRNSASAELRLLSNDHSALFGGRSQWVAGIYYLSNREDLRRRYTYLPSDFRSSYDTDTSAVFGQVNTAMGGNLSLIAGLRWERRDTTYADSADVAFDPSKDLWGGRLILEYRRSENSLLYGGVSRGFRANGVNANILASSNTTENPDIIEQLNTVRAFDEETLINYEIGYKATALNGALQVRSALFYMDRIDQQVKGSFIIPQPDGGTSFIDYTNNAAQGDNYGAELELTWLPLEALMLYANIGLLHTEFETYINADGVDLSGRDQAHAPRYQYALGGRYDFAGGFFLRLDVEGKDAFYFSDRHRVKAPAYDLLNARLGWARGQWSMALWGRNLSDKDYFTRGFGSFGNDPRKEYVTEPYLQFGNPRQVGVSARYDF